MPEVAVVQLIVNPAAETADTKKAPELNKGVAVIFFGEAVNGTEKTTACDVRPLATFCRPYISPVIANQTLLNHNAQDGRGPAFISFAHPSFMGGGLIMFQQDMKVELAGLLKWYQPQSLWHEALSDKYSMLSVLEYQPLRNVAW